MVLNNMVLYHYTIMIISLEIFCLSSIDCLNLWRVVVCNKNSPKTEMEVNPPNDWHPTNVKIAKDVFFFFFVTYDVITL